jgi:hypothetical protein
MAQFSIMQQNQQQQQQQQQQPQQVAAVAPTGGLMPFDLRSSSLARARVYCHLQKLI